MAKRFYDSTRWQRLRRAYLTANPLCEECLLKGITEIAEEVDHKIPIADGGSPTDWDNLQSLSKTCHSRKTRRDNTKKKEIVTSFGYADKETVISNVKGKHRI